MQKEIWKDVLGYEGIYKISNNGRVKSLSRKSWNGKAWHDRDECILKNHTSKVGYLSVGLHRNGKKKTVFVHKLVAMAFLYHTPCGHDLVIDHINNNKSDNRALNLQLTTMRHNVSKDRKKGTSKYTGVHWDKNANRWKASIRIDGKQKYIGIFKVEADAGKAYDMALKKDLSKRENELRTIKLNK